MINLEIPGMIEKIESLGVETLDKNYHMVKACDVPMTEKDVPGFGAGVRNHARYIRRANIQPVSLNTKRSKRLRNHKTKYTVDETVYLHSSRSKKD